VIKGRIIGEVWATKKCEALSPYRLKLVAETNDEGADTGRVLVAMDTLDAERGRTVLVTFGSGARNVLRPGAWDNRDLLCDCAINQVVDGETPGR
jgi:ethanolamine utilization protein EutN